MTKGKEKEVWRLEPEGEAERPEETVPWNGAEGVSGKVKAATGRHGQKSQGMEGKLKQKWKKRRMERHLVKRVRKF